MQSPRSLGLRQPSEWRPHDAVWTAWPAHPDEWYDDLEPPRAEVAALCAAIADLDDAGAPRGERLEVLVFDDEAEASARAALAGLPARLHRIPYGDIWLRDTAPIFVTGITDDAPAGLGAVCCAFNGWGDKYLFAHDPEVRGRIADAVGARRFEYPWILEGGAVDVDGEGTALTTRQCLLSASRNPGMDQDAIEAALGDALGLERVLWLDRGLANDHTDGHVDTLARFVAPGVVVCMEPRAPGDPNRDVLRQIAADLRGLRDAGGRPLEVVAIPSPGEIRGADGALLPASYVNFYIGNSAVVVPVYGSRYDDEAFAAVSALFPDRRTVGASAAALCAGGGAFHCITQQQPAARQP
jgi:agmatine deiminase